MSREPGGSLNMTRNSAPALNRQDGGVERRSASLHARSSLLKRNLAGSVRAMLIVVRGVTVQDRVQDA